MRISILLTLLSFTTSCYQISPGSDYRTPISATTTKFNTGWQFKFESQESWLDVKLPHTPRVEPLLVNDQWQGTMQYSKFWYVEDTTHTAILHFEGVMHEATVFVNDEKVKRHAGGYLPFSVDLTGYLHLGENQIRLEVANTDNSTIPPGKPLAGLDFNYYGGIYRDVWLSQKSKIYISDPFLENNKNSGWQIHFNEISQKQAKGNVKVHLRNDFEQSQPLVVKVKLSQENISHEFQQSITMAPSTAASVDIPITVNSPSLWSTSSPHLYSLSIHILTLNGILADQVEDKVGIRKIELKNGEFFLNEKQKFIRGTNRHQEYPYIGYAISNNANYRDALKIKNAGFDFVRLSHYPQDESFLDACDELGLLVMNAIPGWQYYEEGEFVDNSFQDIRDMVRRDRNHPSVIFWEVSLNESGMTNEYMTKANLILKEELPYDDTYSAGWIDHPSYDLFIPARQHNKPPHYWNNYKEGKRNLFISEYGDWEYYAHNAGFNQAAFENLTSEERNSRQLRAHGEKRLLQQAFNYQEAANSNRKGKSTIGHANWLMFDYNRGYADDLEASGISDIFRIPKFANYFYQSQRPATETIEHPLVVQGPMVKIASYWTKESSTDISIFSNCDEVALYLNDKLVAKQRPIIDAFSDHLHSPPFKFQLKQFEPGVLKAVGYINGEPVVSDSVETHGPAAKIQVQIATDGINSSNEEDLVFVYARIVDTKGNLVVNATDEVFFDLEGKGELIGANPIKAEAGIATILFRGETSDIKIKAYANNLTSAAYQ